jgi:hypothetical protein
VAGVAHVQTGTGIPDRVTRRWAAPRLVVACGAEVDAPDGDVLFVTAPRRPSGDDRPPAPSPAPDRPRWY